MQISSVFRSACSFYTYLTCKMSSQVVEWRHLHNRCTLLSCIVFLFPTQGWKNSMVQKSPCSSAKVRTNVIYLVSPIMSWDKTVCLVVYLAMNCFQLLHANKFRQLSVNTLVLLYAISFLGRILTTSEHHRLFLLVKNISNGLFFLKTLTQMWLLQSEPRHLSQRDGGRNLCTLVSSLFQTPAKQTCTVDECALETCVW